MPYASGIGGLRITRCAGEEIVLGEGDNEVVVVVETASGGRAQIRVVAPPYVRIMRAELLGKENEK